MKKLALAGAEATLARLRQEVQILERTFPELATTKGRAKLAESINVPPANAGNAARRAADLPDRNGNGRPAGDKTRK